MQNNGNTENHEQAAELTVKLVDHGNTPNEIGDAVLEKLIELSGESQINIWHRETGLSVQSLTALYRMYQTGAGYRKSRLYADYEISRLEREREGNGKA